jgi:hypothetical protein
VLNILEDIQSQGDADRARNTLNPPPKKAPRQKPEPYPNAPRLLESRPRPSSELSGRRHVPFLIGANGIPYLRIKKPQPVFLSRVINDKIKQKQKRQDHVERIEADMAWAEDEENWENLVGSRVAQGSNSRGDRNPWSKDMIDAKKEVEWRLSQGYAKAQNTASKMLKIVDEEKRLFEEEGIERKREKDRIREEQRPR